VRKAAGVASGRVNNEPLPNRDKVIYQSPAERTSEQLREQRDFLTSEKNRLLNSRAGRRGKETKHIIHEELTSSTAARDALDRELSVGRVVERVLENYEVTRSHTRAGRPCRSFRTLKTVDYEPRVGRRPSLTEIRTTTLAPHSETKRPSVLTTTIERETNPLSRPSGSLNPFRNRQTPFLIFI
jgi:hypothetical protein